MFKIKVPATTANVGPGFDCLGMALNIYNEFEFEVLNSGLIIEGCDDEFKNENNLVYTSMLYFFKKYNCKPPTGLKINFITNVPVCRGLGSSATCIVAGIMAANKISNKNFNKDELLKVATKLEGHPDNVAPALFGNMITSLLFEDKVFYNVIEISEQLTFCAMVPNFKLSTSLSRSVLPSNINYKDALFNISRVSLLVSSLINNNFDNLNVACQDKLHQSYRGKLIPDFENIITKANTFGAKASFLSGAGPTIMAITTESSFIDNINNYLCTLENNWKTYTLKCDKTGALII